MIAASSTSPSPLLTKEGKEEAESVNELLNTYKDDRREAGMSKGGVMGGHKKIPAEG